MPKDMTQGTKKLMIIGGAGYIGSRLVPVLIENGHEITIVDEFWFGDHLPFCEKIHRDAAKLEEQDMRGFDCVVWLAGLSNDPMANFSPAENFSANAALPAYIAYLARKAGVKRFIHGGSCSVYGDASDYEHDEESKPNAIYPYGVAKLMAEIGCGQQASKDFSVIMLRKGTVSGWSPRMRFDLIVNTMFRDAVLSGVINVNNPNIWRPIVAMEDAVEAYVKAMDAPDGTSGIFNIVSENATVLDVAERVGALTKIMERSVALNVHHKADPRNYRVNGSAASRILGFEPKGTVETIVADLETHRSEFGDYSDARFYNIETFKMRKS